LATWVSGISDSGDIVGYYNDGTTFHGFLLSKGKFTGIQPPALDGDLARGINARGDIVGQFGPVLSTVATILQMTAVLAATNRATLYEMRFALAAAGIAALIYGAIQTFLSVRQETAPPAQKGRAFSLKSAVLFAGMIAVMLFLSAALNAQLGKAGVLAAAAVAGFADTHSAAVSVASLVAAGRFAARDAVIPILAGLTTNTIAKAAVAISTGGRRFAAQIIPGLVIVIAAAWVAAGFALVH
jgi:uncharacterized membrane protein (DUF4010 family)